MYQNFNNNDILAVGGLKMILDLKQIDKETADKRLG